MTARAAHDWNDARVEALRRRCPGKFAGEEAIFGHVHPGDRIFVGTACGEPQYLMQALMRYVEAHPKAFLDAEVIHVWTLGVAPYADERFEDNFRSVRSPRGGDARFRTREAAPRVDDATRAARRRGMVPDGDIGPLLVEAGADLACGASIGLDAVSLARDLAAGPLSGTPLPGTARGT